MSKKRVLRQYFAHEKADALRLALALGPRAAARMLASQASIVWLRTAAPAVTSFMPVHSSGR